MYNNVNGALRSLWKRDHLTLKKKKKKESQKAEGAQDFPALRVVVTHSPPQGRVLSLVTTKPPVPPELCRTRQKAKTCDWQHQCPPRLVLQEFGWVFFQVQGHDGLSPGALLDVTRSAIKEHHDRDPGGLLEGKKLCRFLVPEGQG